jgi:predicted nucleic acid-binding protein
VKILLDTNAYSDWRRTGRWNEAISTASEVLIPAIVLGELRYGFAGSTKAVENESKLWMFLNSDAVEVLNVSEATSRTYANLKYFLRNVGKPIPENDIWIAALAVEHGVHLVTSDAHFDHLPQVARVME